MKPPPHSGSRRSTAGAKAPGKASRTVDLPAGPARKPRSSPGRVSRARPSAKAPASGRRAPMAPRDRRKTWLIWSTTAVVSVVMLAMTAGVWASYRENKSGIRDRQATLSYFKSQADIGNRRLKALSSPRGREQLLLENGYIRPGERLLLFPRTKEEQMAARVPKNDLSPHVPSDETVDSSGSTWKSAGNALRRWWSGVTSGKT